MSGYPTEIGDYEIRGVLGRGASGTVFLAHQESIDRRVALKELSTELTADPVFRERFRAEAEVMARLDNDHCVRVFDFFQREKNDYLVSELIEGASLRRLVEHAGELTPEESLGVLKGALQGLAHAHSLGLIHRDIKPENVLLDLEGTSKLADFGQAAVQSGPGAAGGMPAGSPAYMSPEMVSGGSLDPRSDLYSAGAVLFELMTGRLPFVADNPLAMMRMQREAAVPDAHAVNSNLGPGITGLLAASLAKDPAQRPQSADAMLASLETVAAEAYGADWEKRSSLKRKVAAAVGAGMGLLAMLATASGLAAAAAVGTAAVASAAGSSGVLGLGTWIAGGGVVAVLVLGGGYLALRGNNASTNRPANGPVAVSTPNPAAGATPSAGPGPSTKPSASPSTTPPSSSASPSTLASTSPGGLAPAARPVPSPRKTFIVVPGTGPGAPAPGLTLSNARVFFLDCTTGCGFYSDGFPYYSPATAYPSGSAMDCRISNTFSVFDQWDFNNSSSTSIPVTVQWAIKWADGTTATSVKTWSIPPSSTGTHLASGSTARDQPPVPAPFGSGSPPAIGTGTYTLTWNNPDGSSHTMKAQQPMYWSCETTTG